MRKLLSYTLLLSLVTTQSLAQRINFKPFVQGENITLTLVENPLGLNFNLKQSIIVAGDPSPVTISLTETQAVVVEIEAPLDYDLTFELSSNGRMSIGNMDTGITVPFTPRYAYNNTGETSDMARRMSAVQLPQGFSVVTLPVRRRQAGGPPGPPPTPEHGGYVRPRGSVFLYIYGDFGPADAQAPAGIYSGTIELNVNYSDNAF